MRCIGSAPACMRQRTPILAHFFNTNTNTNTNPNPNTDPSQQMAKRQKTSYCGLYQSSTRVRYGTVRYGTVVGWDGVISVGMDGMGGGRGISTVDYVFFFDNFYAFNIDTNTCTGITMDYYCLCYVTMDHAPQPNARSASYARLTHLAWVAWVAV